ncbi:uncharacterized protein [Antedon mediterranea]|uniref:uncharacterized protein n=1 Tax=Antedon mediterranea TaxID=105859 RepID=UPI003AF73DAC
MDEKVLLRAVSSYTGLEEIEEICKTYPHLVNSVDKDGNTPLHRHVTLGDGNVEIVNSLIAHGASITATNNEGNTPLHKHVTLGDGIVEIVNSLIAHGASIKATNNDGNTPLHQHVYFGYGEVEIVNSLIAHRASVTATNNRGNTPLHGHVECGRGNVEIVNSFIAHGASISATNNLGSTPLHKHVTFADGNVEILNSIIAHGASVTATDNEGNTPLHGHVRFGGNLEIVNSLIAHGASLKARNKRGQTPASALKDNSDISKEKKNTILKLLDIPVEILARGKSAIRSFQNELENGEIAVVNSRCMFLGKEGAGKTSCVKAMLGQRFKSNEPSTDGIAITTTLFQAIGKECDKWKKEDIDVMELNKKIREDALAEKLATQLIKEEMDDGEGSSDMSTSKSDSQLESSAISSLDPVKIGTSPKTPEHITANMEKQTSTETKFHLQENSRFKQTQRIFLSFNDFSLGEASTFDSRESDYTSLAVESARKVCPTREE